MNTARIVVLAIAVGAGSAAACAARGPDHGSFLPAGRMVRPAAPGFGLAVMPESKQFDPARRSGLPALTRIADLDIIRSSARDDRAYRRGDGIVVTAQK